MVFAYFNDATGTSGALLTLTYAIDPTANFSREHLSLWLRAENGVSVTGSNVTSWLDYSGNNNNAVQATTTYQPTLQSNQINGKPVVRFDGGSGGSGADYLSIPDNARLNPDKFTIFVIGKYDNSGGSTEGPFVIKSVNTDPIMGDGYRVGRYSSTYAGVYFAPGAASFVPFANNTYGLIEARYDRNQLRLLVNGDGSQAGFWMPWSGPITNQTGPLYLGSLAGSNGLKGDIAEVLFFDRALTVAEEAAVEKYLSARYGLSTDADGDGLPYWLEIQLGTDPNNPDSNGDGWDDGPEYYAGYSPTSTDVDGDLVPNAVEIAAGTNPFWGDTDNDGVQDNVDPYPFDPTPVATDPAPTVGPSITLQQPTNAVLVP
jgi:hypothetical protein